MTHVPYPGCYCADCVEGTPPTQGTQPINTVSQEAVEVKQADRIAACQIADAMNDRNFTRAHQLAARHRQSAERGEVVGYIIPEMLNRKSEFEANGMVMFDRPCGAATMPLYAEPPSARITGDKDRSVQSRAPTQRIIILTEANRQLATECHRLRAALRWIADTGYVDQQSGNQNFEHLQSIARDALTKEPTP